MARRAKKSTDDGTGKSRDDCEQRSGPIAGTAIISGATFRNKGLAYANVDGEALFEGDIVLGKAEVTGRARAPRSGGLGPRPLASLGISGAQFRWPNGTIPFEIDAGLPNQQRVTDAIAHWHANTQIRLVARDPAQHPDFVRFVPGGGCSSMVGKQGGPQNITLGPACTTGNCIHEIGHTVGLWHEQSREDRDTFVQIVWANIDPSMQHNFTQHVADGDDLGAYDFGSIMHYPANAFSVNGQNTILPRQALPAGIVMGQRTGLSAGDIAGVQAMYPGGRPTVKELAKDPIADPIHTMKEVNKDPVQDTVKEVRKDPIRDPTVKEIRKDPITDPTTVKEVRKDPIRETTIKETALDPVVRPGPLGPGPFRTSAAPFVLATPSRAGYGAGMASDDLSAAAEHVEQLAAAIGELEAQHAELAAAYDAAVQLLEALQGQG